MSDDSRLPIVTLILIVANIVAAFALLWQPDLIHQFGFDPAHPTLQSIFASLFLHANLLHLLANMLFLAAVGAAVEMATGSLRFFIVYFVSGLVGIGFHALFAARIPHEPHPLVGASGCIAGCAAYYGIRYLGLRVPLMPKVGVPVAAILAVWLALQVLGAMKTIGDPMASTAFWAHIGGFVAGLALSFVFRAPDFGHLKLHHAVLERMNERGPAAAVAAALRHLEVHPNDPVALEQLANAHQMMDDHEGEAGALVRLIALLPIENVGDLVKRLDSIGQANRLTALQRVRMAEKLAPHDRGAAELLYMSVVDLPSVEPQVPDAMLALAGLIRNEQPEAAEDLLRRLLREHPLHPAADLARARGWIA